MIVVSNVTYPPESTKEIAKRYLTAPPLPDFITKKGRTSLPADGPACIP